MRNRKKKKIAQLHEEKMTIINKIIKNKGIQRNLKFEENKQKHKKELWRLDILIKI
ncbi:uncharacterized protein MELLADRAFT_92396 [Melampsora larici-populina 98AG31]|uniref:Uncharacterized protein n=1 Tax=Melampsora larici-populina (strain 98AG31 / pathotype 3-4-7) TaxID=747676 RepID=F4R9H3_MELLP|nr:uncharacterized protein MELLADRAFT_92396 [Melampsora larici-populina 98AG31]EGG10982.1 hypothetical protein MELLADRAFT_92396 [Melampsora larici-populina 98AG31]